MKKSILLCTCFFLFISFIAANTAKATDTRAKGMALNKDTRWMIDGLVTYCYNNPAYLKRSGRQVFLELTLDGASVDYLGGILLKAGNKLNLGLFSGFKVGDDGDAFDSSSDQYSYLFTGADTTGLTLTDQYFTLMAAFKVSRFLFGLKFGWAGSSYKVDGGLEKDAHAFVIGLGSYFRVKGRFSLEISPEITIYWISIFQDPSGDNVFESDGTMDMIIPLRLNYNFSAKNKLHIMGGFSYLNRSTKDANNKWDRSGYKIFFGLSNEWRASNNILVLFGLNMDYYDKSYNDGSGKDEIGLMFLPFHLGIEGRLPKNWIIRCGLKHNIIEYEVEKLAGTETTTLGSGSVTGALGLGLRLGKLTIDWNLNAVIFIDGPHFISGQSNTFATDFAVSYNF